MAQLDEHIRHRSFRGNHCHILAKRTTSTIRKIAPIDFFRGEVTSCLYDLCYRWPPSGWR